MDIKKVEQAILKYNPLNLIKNDYIFYESIYTHISSVKNLTANKLQQIFIDHFGDTRILFEMRMNSNIYQKIYDEIIYGEGINKKD
jgi:hypothetical protein